MPLSKLYTDDTNKLPIQACSGNQYITIAYHKQCNVILCTPNVNWTTKYQLAANNSIMHRLTNRGHTVDFQILINEVSAKFKATIKETWKHNTSPLSLLQALLAGALLAGVSSAGASLAVTLLAVVSLAWASSAGELLSGIS
jgi:hypothetical protein